MTRVMHDWLQANCPGFIERMSGPKLFGLEPAGLSRLGTILEKYHKRQPKPKTIDGFKSPHRPSRKSLHKNTSTRRWQTSPRPVSCRRTSTKFNDHTPVAARGCLPPGANVYVASPPITSVLRSGYFSGFLTWGVGPLLLPRLSFPLRLSPLPSSNFPPLLLPSLRSRPLKSSWNFWGAL